LTNKVKQLSIPPRADYKPAIPFYKPIFLGALLTIVTLFGGSLGAALAGGAVIGATLASTISDG